MRFLRVPLSRAAFMMVVSACSSFFSSFIFCAINASSVTARQCVCGAGDERGGGVQARKGYSLAALHSTSTEALLLTFAVQIVIVTAVISATGAAHGGVQALAALFAAGKVHVERGKGYGSGRGWVQPPLHRPKLLMAPQKGEWAKRSRMVQWKAT